jgi:hypothetical protein
MNVAALKERTSKQTLELIDIGRLGAELKHILGRLRLVLADLSLLGALPNVR